MLTGKLVQNFIEHALRGPMSARIQVLDVVNQAGDFLVNMHPWRWADGRAKTVNVRGVKSVTGALWTEATKTLSKTNGFAGYVHVPGDEWTVTSGTGATLARYKIDSKPSDDALVFETSIGSAANGSTNIAANVAPSSVALPDDFGSILSPSAIVGPNYIGPMPTSLAELNALRVMAGTGQPYWYAVAYGSTLSMPPRPILEIYPSSPTDVADAFTLFYSYTFPHVDDDSALIRIPEWIDGFYVQIAREIALGLEEHDNRTLIKRLAELASDYDPSTGGKTLFWVMKQRDGSVQPSYGKPLNTGAMRRGRASLDRAILPFTTVGGPTL